MEIEKSKFKDEVKMKKVNTTVVFSTIWLVFLVCFLIMGYQSLMSIKTELPRYTFEAPTSATMNLGGINIAEAIEGIAKTHDATVAKLEESIKSEAKTMTAINFVSALLCFFGLLAQIADHQQKNIKGRHES